MGAWHSAQVYPCVPGPWTPTSGLQGWGGESWSVGRRAEVRAVSAGRDWNAGAAAKADGVIALGLGNELGFPGCLPLSVQVSELLPGPGLGACEIVDSSSLPVLESPSAALASAAAAVAAEAGAAGGCSAGPPCPCQADPFETWEGAVPWGLCLLA